MAGKMEDKEQLYWITLQNMRARGHKCIELRKDNKSTIYFCILCLTRCYNDSALFDHLKGKLHTCRLSVAKATLMKPNPWPFNDGVCFFDISCEMKKQLAIENHGQERLLQCRNNDNNLSIVKYGETSHSVGNGHTGFGNDNLDGENGDGKNCDVVIPGVLVKEEIAVLEAKFIGLGKIAARMFEKDDGANEITRIWCEWLGNNDVGEEDAAKIPNHDFALITFAYSYDLGRKALLDYFKLLLSPSPVEELSNDEGNVRKRLKYCSDLEDLSRSLSNQNNSCGEDSSVSNTLVSRQPPDRQLLDPYDDQLLNTKFMLSKSQRRELRRKKRILSERTCDICQQPMLQDKDVAALMNMKTGKLACSSRNLNGAFHVFHISCLIHWVVFCEFEMLTNQAVTPKVKQRDRKNNGGKRKEMMKEGDVKPILTQVGSVFCPECQGTGMNIEREEIEELEHFPIPLAQMFKYKIKMSDGRSNWMKSPEVLPNCSTGLHFPSESAITSEEKVLLLKWLRIYRAVVH